MKSGRWIFVLLSLTGNLLVGVFAGCGNTASDSISDAGDVGSDSSTADAAFASDADGVDAAAPSRLSQLRAALDAQEKTTSANRDASVYRTQIQSGTGGLYLGLTALEIEHDTASAKDFIASGALPLQTDAGCFEFSASNHDTNANVFASLALAVIWDRWSTAFDASFQSSLNTSLIRAGGCLDANPVNDGASYTNIALQHAVARILIGEATANDAMTTTAYAEFDNWYQYTREGGIAEFVSPTYTAVDLYALEMGSLLAKNAAEQSKMHNALDFIWADVKASYFAPAGSLAGAHSRDYDWMQGIDIDDMNLNLWLESNQDSLPSIGGNLTGTMVIVQDIFLYINAISAGGYHPNWDASPVTSDLDGGRFISESFPLGYGDGGPVSLGLRQTYTTPDFSLGHSDPNHNAVGGQDKPLNHVLATAKPFFTNITVVPNIYDDPYGQDNYDASAEYGGELVHDHLELNSASAQKNGALLTTFDLDAAATYTSLSTNILLPISADTIWANGTTLSPAMLNGPLDMPIPNGGWIGIREGNTGVLLQLYVADRLGDQMATSVLKVDSFAFSDFMQNGIPENLTSTHPVRALRWAYYHYSGSSMAFSQPHLRGTVVVIAQHVGSDADWAALLARTTSSGASVTSGSTTWDAKVNLPDGSTLEVTRDNSALTNFTALVDGVPVAVPRMMQNGVDLTPQLALFGP